MAKVIQIRNVPERLSRKLKARARSEGMSLSALLRIELEQLVQRPTMREWLESTKTSTPIRSAKSATQIIRELRDSR
jgi:plasmid stability protein